MNTETRTFRTLGIRNSVLVILLTILAGALRFSAIDKPSIWGDEAATWRRVSGSYQQMLDELRTAGFMPAHYLLTWWIKDGFPYWGQYEKAERATQPDRESPWFRRFNEPGDPAMKSRMVWTPTHRLIPGGITPTPLVLRFFPALCGTLMVPAMYFLASRLVSRRTALLVALFTCCSAYMLNYSRDAKMYEQFWFFATLHVGCLLWWLEAYKRKPIAAPTGRSWSKQAELGAGVAGVLSHQHVQHIAGAFGPQTHAGTGGFYPPRRVGFDVEARLNTFLRWTCWLTAGLAMIAFHAVGLAIVGIELVIVLATIPQRLAWIQRGIVFVRARLTRNPFDVAEERSSWVSHLCIPPVLSFVVGACCIVSLFTSYRQFTRFYSRVEPSSTQSVQYDVDDAGIGWVDPYNEGRTAAGHFLENATAYLMSWEWPKSASLMRGEWPKADDAEDEAAKINPVALKRLWWAAVALLCAIGAGLVPWKALLDRMTAAPRVRGPMPMAALLIVGVWLLVPAYGIYVASGAWDATGSKEPALSPVATIASAIWPTATPGDVEPLRGSVAVALRPFFAGDQTWAATRKALGSLPYRELFIVKHVGAVRWWAVATIAGALLIGAIGWRRPTLLVNTSGTGRGEDPDFKSQIPDVRSEISDSRFSGFRSGAFADPAPVPRRTRTLRARRIAAWWGSLAFHVAAFAVAIGILIVLLNVAFVAVPMQAESVWMPRYLGFVWPAFAISICVLIRRLPLLPLRWLVIAGLLATNLTVFYHRVTLGEPPTGEIARDIIATGDRHTARVFSAVLARGKFGGPGAGGIYSMPAGYYYHTLSGEPTTPRDAFHYFDRNDFATQLGPGNPNALRATLRRDAIVTDAYVWAQVKPGAGEKDFENQIATTLSPGWAPAEPAKRWMIYDHWTWMQLYAMERHHWKRVPATQPTTAPTKMTAPPKAIAPTKTTVVR